MAGDMDLKVCPFWAYIAMNSEELKIKYHEMCLSEEPEDAAPRSYLNYGDCKGKFCQLWNEKTQDCGLKQPDNSVNLGQINETLAKILDKVEDLPNDISDEIVESNRFG
jgi:hypothetical protein